MELQKQNGFSITLYEKSITQRLPRFRSGKDPQDVLLHKKETVKLLQNSVY